MNINLDKSVFDNEVQNLGLLDSGCPESCAGESWMRQYEESIGKTLDTKNKVEYFKFGDTTYKARYYKIIPINLGSQEKVIEVAVVDAQVPLLISNGNLKDCKAMIDFEKDERN